MGFEYFKETICDELCGAKDYIVKAIEIRAMAPAWADVLVKMSAEELDHAQRLYKMFEEYYVKQSASYNNNPPEYITGIRKEIVEMVTEKTTEVKYLHDMFKK